MFCFEARNTYLRVPLRGLRHEKQPSKIQLQLLGICLHTTRLNFGYICREQIGTGPGASSGAGYRARWGGGAGAGSAEEVPELPDEVLVEVPGQVPEHLADTLSLHVVTLICFRGVTLTCRHVCALPKTKFITRVNLFISQDEIFPRGGITGGTPSKEKTSPRGRATSLFMRRERGVQSFVSEQVVLYTNPIWQCVLQQVTECHDPKG